MVANIACVVMIVLQCYSISGINLGLIAGDNKRFGSPLVIKKVSHRSPIFINVHPKPMIPPLLPPKLPKLPKPPPSLKKSLRKLRSPLSPPLIKPILLPPLIPKLPFLPFFPPVLPPFLPIIPPPILPILPRLKSPLSPFKVSIIKTPLQKALGSELKPVTVPCLDTKNDLLGTLRELRRKGSLTTAEFTRFKKLLLKKK